MSQAHFQDLEKTTRTGPDWPVPGVRRTIQLLESIPPFDGEKGNEKTTLCSSSNAARESLKSAILRNAAQQRASLRPSLEARVHAPPEMWGRRDLLAALCRWAGNPQHFDGDLWKVARRLNSELHRPIDDGELERLVLWVEDKRQNEWPETTRHKTRFLWHSRQGQRSGLARRLRTQARDRAIVRARKSGATFRQLAHQFGLSVSTVHHVVKRKAIGKDGQIP